MPQKDSKTIQHDPNRLPTTSRGRNAEDHINDLFEESDGLGFSEVVYKAPPQQVFVDKITVWDSQAKNFKRTEFLFDYGTSFPFIETIVKNVYNKDGTAIVAITTSVFVYNPNKTIQEVNVVSSRP